MRRVLRVAAVLLVLLLGADTLLWRWAQGRLAAAVAACHAEGWTITAAPAQRGGWPLAATLSLANLAVTGPAVLTWSTEGLILSVSLLHPSRLRLTAEGTQRLKLAGLPEAVYTAGRLEAAVALQPTEPRQFSLDAADLRAVPPDRSWPFGPQLASLTLEASLGGGTIDVQHLAIRWGRLDATATATVGLDEGKQPSGAGTVRIVDPSAALAELVARGALTDRAAFAASAMLALMTHPAPDGGKPAVELPLALHNQLVLIGQVPLARLPFPTGLAPP